MTHKQAHPDLQVALKSEVYGQASFRSAFWLSIGRRKTKALALWQLEQQTQAAVEEHFVRHRLARPNTTFESIKGAIIGVIFPLFPWPWVMKIMLRETEPFLAVFKRLQTNAEETDQPFFNYLVAHEVAIREFAMYELNKQPDQALSTITKLLNRPI